VIRCVDRRRLTVTRGDDGRVAIVIHIGDDSARKYVATLVLEKAEALRLATLIQGTAG
jgi:hypothetical protein